MKLLVISDTHGNYPAAARAAESVEPVDRIIHLGDCSDDTVPLSAALGRTILGVAGNCDHDSPLSRELICSFDSVPFLICHGDRYGVKGGIGKLIEYAKRREVKGVLFGHTHQPCVIERDGMLFINPGTLQSGAESPSFALVVIDRGTVSAQIRFLHSSPP